MMLHGAEF